MPRRSRQLLRAGAALASAAAIGVLALRRADIPYPQLERAYGAPGSRFLPGAGGIRLHYRDEGRRDAPVLMLVHGYAASAIDWDPWIARLAPHYRVISLDLPGHGLTAAAADTVVAPGSLADLVAGLADDLALPPFVLVGNSMGGLVACEVALRRPGRLAGLVLINAITAVRRPPSTTSPVFRMLASRLGRALMRQIDLTPLVRRSLGVAFHDAALVTPAVVRRYTDLARAPGHRAILTTLQVEGDAGLRDRLPSLRVPTLVMIGEDDRLVAPADGRRLAAGIPGARLIAYPGVGHVPMQQIPDRSAADLRAWLAEVVFPA